MSIVTKSGDGGLTSLFSGERVPKDDIHIEALGDMDELISSLALASHFCELQETKAALDKIQSILNSAMTEVASADGERACGVSGKDIALIEAEIATLEQRLPIRGFVKLGQTQGSAFLDNSRAIARRVERRVHTLDRRQPVSLELRRYLNRISDYIFLLARNEEAVCGKGPVYRT